MKRTSFLVVLVLAVLSALPITAQTEGCVEAAATAVSSWTMESLRQSDDDELTSPVMVFMEGCDPIGDYFSESGELADPGERMNHISIGLRPIRDAYQKLPLLVRKTLWKRMLPNVADLAQVYLGPKFKHDNLLGLEWERDIESIELSWFDLDWPEDSSKRLTITDFDTKDTLAELSWNELWIRAFWKRRGQELFEAAKAAMQDS